MKKLLPILLLAPLLMGAVFLSVLGPTGQVTVSWDRPTQYTDNSLLYLKTFKVKYGAADGGPYNTVIDMADDTDPGMLSRAITGLNIGQTYYGVVTTIDSEGNESANSSQWSAAAAAPIAFTNPSHDYTIAQTDIPKTITAGGVYKITENLSANSGVVIDIDLTTPTDDVTIFSTENHKITYASTGVGNAIRISEGSSSSGDPTGLTFHGFEIVYGGYSYGAGENIHGIWFNHAYTGGDHFDWDIHDITATIGLSNQNNSTAPYWISAIQMGNVTGGIYNNTVTVKGGGSGLVNLNNDFGTVAGLDVYNNDFTQQDSNMNQDARGLFEPKGEIYGNTFTCINHDGERGCTPISNPIGAYIHGNTFTDSGSATGRHIVIENTNSDNVVLHNTWSITDSEASGSPWLLRIRALNPGTKPINNLIGFNTITSGVLAHGGSAGFSYGGDESGQIPTDNATYYNDFSGYQGGAALLLFDKWGPDNISWGNDYRGESYGVWARGYDQEQNDEKFRGDTIHGRSGNDVYFECYDTPPCCNVINIDFCDSYDKDSNALSFTTASDCTEGVDYDDHGATSPDTNCFALPSGTPKAPTNVSASGG